MTRAPFCNRCRSTHPAADACPTHPRITFTSSKQQLPSSDNVVRFAVMRSESGIVTVTADWWHLPFSLTPEASQRVFDTCNRLSTHGVKSCGGGKTCLRIVARASGWNQIRREVAAVLANPSSWSRVHAHSKLAASKFETLGETHEEFDYSLLLEKTGDQNNEKHQ